MFLILNSQPEYCSYASLTLSLSLSSFTLQSFAGCLQAFTELFPQQILHTHFASSACMNLHTAHTTFYRSLTLPLLSSLCADHGCALMQMQTPMHTHTQTCRLSRTHTLLQTYTHTHTRAFSCLASLIFFLSIVFVTFPFRLNSFLLSFSFRSLSLFVFHFDSLRIGFATFCIVFFGVFSIIHNIYDFFIRHLIRLIICCRRPKQRSLLSLCSAPLTIVSITQKARVG